MGKQSRWMEWVLDEADRLNVTLPWHRKTRSSAWKRRLSGADIHWLPAKG